MSYGVVVVARNPEDVKLDLPNQTVVAGQMSLNEARNIGARKNADKDFIAFIDDDNQVPPSALSKMVETMNADEKVGAVSPIIYDGKGKPWFSGGRFDGLGVARIRRWINPLGEVETETFHDCFMVRRSAFEEVGGFDSERFPFYLGEADLAERLMKAGYSIKVSLGAQVKHLIDSDEGILRGAHIRNQQRAYLVGRNLLLFLKLHRSRKTVFLHEVLVLPVRTLYHLWGMATEGHLDYVAPYLRGVRDGLKV